MRATINNTISKIRNVINLFFPLDGIAKSYDILIHKEYRDRMSNHPNPINRKGLFGFSQSEEDGITLEILRRMKIGVGSFIEFGVGNGMENNTIILLASGWKGFWFGGQDLWIDDSSSSRLDFTKTWITKENIQDLYKSTKSGIDMISLDLDGNDIYFATELLENGADPSLFVVEYNAKFPPGVEFQIAYDKDHNWQSDDYHGASLQSFVELFHAHGYMLVCCNLSGANAFFVKNSFREEFSDVPKEIEDLYSPPFYFLRKQKMHETSVRTIQRIIEN